MDKCNVGCTHAYVMSPFQNLWGIYRHIELFFLDFCTNMYMVEENAGKSSGNENVKSMYMMVKHVHDMYMSRHALIVNLSCICYVYVW